MTTIVISRECMQGCNSEQGGKGVPYLSLTGLFLTLVVTWVLWALVVPCGRMTFLATVRAHSISILGIRKLSFGLGGLRWLG